MAITTQDGALAGIRPMETFSKAGSPTLVAGRPHSYWYIAGVPGAGSAVSSTTAGGVALSSTSAQVAGQIRHSDPGSGNAYLHYFEGVATIAGVLMLWDRLLQVCAISAGTILSVTSTSAQTINSNTLPARDNASSTNGDGVLVAIEIVSVMGAGTPTITMSYTNSAGTSGRSATNIDPVIATSAAGATYRMGLQAGDTGVRSIQSITLSATMTSGQISIVFYRPLAVLPISAPATPAAVDLMSGAFQQIPNGAVPYLVFLPQTTTSTLLGGAYVETQG